MIADDASLEEVSAYFKNDLFATKAAGCVVKEAGVGEAVCEMELADIHYNAMHNVMGGAIFTLADYALAVACNVGKDPTVSIASSIHFFTATRGTRLIAKAREDHTGRTIGFYTIDIFDDAGLHIARMTSTVKRFPPKTPTS